MNSKIFAISFGLLICCYADSERQNCRENLSLINDQKHMALILAIAEPVSSSRPPLTQKEKEVIAGYYAYLDYKFNKKKRQCDGDLILKITSPEANDFK